MCVNSLSIPLFASVEEESDEIKIGTSCKNGGCTKVSKRVTEYQDVSKSSLNVLICALESF